MRLAAVAKAGSQTHHRREGENIAALTPVTLDKRGITIVLYRLARKPGRARDLYGKLMGSWGHRPDRERITVKLGEQEFQVLESLNLPQGIVSQDVLTSGWVTLYRHPKHPELEVKVTTKQKPPKRRTLRVGGNKRQLVAVSCRRVGKNHKEAYVATRTKKRKQEEDLEDELEGLEDLEDIDDEDLEDEEPEDEDLEGEDEEEEEEPAPKRKTSSKKTSTKAKTAARKRKAPEPEDEDDDEDEEEEEEPPKRTAKKGSTKTTKSSTKGKSASTKGKAAKSTSTKAKKNGNLPATRELPKGQVGPSEIAEMVGGDCDSRYVRIYLRENYERPDGGRWAFGKQDARTIAKDIKAQRRKNA